MPDASPSPPRRRWGLALAALPVLAVLLGLGTWQVRRLHWKTELLAHIAAAEAGPTQPLSASPEPFAKVAATGRFDHGREALLGVELRGTTLGARLLTPLLREGAPPLLVDRGWVPLERDRPIGHPEGEVTVTGYVRPADSRDWNSPKDDPAGRRFYLFDPAAIGQALDLPPPAPFGLVALAAPGATPATLPVAASALPRPTNPHLGYAVTWYGLAAALAGVVLAALWRRPEPAPPLPAGEDGP
ncbi:SURF1 family protein [Siccirubricoccus sp. KC 17139]|uniref:SURF1-like protein n=1 Tax=Siccirubricoccus soli TaxID=2899147 RepID=A0ABT1D7M9_9PROT|nr:SURF1 family protein [Siccirubricoccus soli]MCO6417617.1 SURF1 family protein [Siccirubricoccus soli]MCP2683752.1 SURF1 family protein [Siccirubricoccus soli]